MPETLANKIAAGEVVQRPASAAKELIENALDAGATAIHLILRKAGRELIQVVDNGCGMSAADAVACFQRHATSKIRGIDDLERLRTLGFRGEALASISAVAQIELRTQRRQDPAGTLVRVDGGELVEQAPCATVPGTSVAVRNLFYNVPVRRNFLKTPATEFKHLLETFQFLALSHPTTGFRLTHDDNEVYHLRAAPAAASRLDAMRHRIVELFGESHRDHLVPLEEETSYLSVLGLVGAPSFHRRSRGEQFLFVNDRYVKSRYLEHAVFSGYGASLPEGAFPFITLFLTIDPRHVDVNVHPTKAEVKFDDERGIYSFLQAVTRKGLATHDLTPQLGSPGFEEPLTASRQARLGGVRPATLSPSLSTAGSGAYSPAEARPAPRRFGDGGSAAPPARPGVQSRAFYDLSDPEAGWTPSPLFEQTPEAVPTVPTSSFEPVTEEALMWQLHGRYILTQIRSGLAIIDQRAAHERILYERLLNTLQHERRPSQQLMFPQTVEFNTADFQVLRELQPTLEAIGYVIESFGGRTVVIQGVPADMPDQDEQGVLEEIVRNYTEYAGTKPLSIHEHVARGLARKQAIRHGAPLSPEAMRTLVDQLFQCTVPFQCPSGHPTVIRLTHQDLAERFGRS